MEGPTQVLLYTLKFSRDVLFWNKCLYLYERFFTEKSAAGNTVPQTPPGPFHLKVVSSNREADELEMDGFGFRTMIPYARRSLEAGAIAFCVFHGNEIASLGWVALDEKAQASLPEPHIMVNFAGNESFTGGSVTSPKFRRMGLMTYNLQERCRFLKNKGIEKDRSSAFKWNPAARKAALKAGYRIRGTVGFKNRPGRRIWKEWSLS